MENETERQQTATKLRQAVTAEAYDEVQPLLTEYRGHVERALASLPAGSPTPAALAQEAGELMRWALEAVRAARARARDDLDQASAVLRYCHPVQHIPTWKIEG